MGAGSATKHRRKLTGTGWLAIGLAIAIGIGVLIGAKAIWLGALILLLLVLMGTFAVPRNVRDLNVPPDMMNVPGDITRHHDEED